MPRTSLIVALIFVFLFFFLVLARLTFAQDAATGAIHGTVVDPAGARIARASVVAVDAATGVRYSVTCDAEGRFALELLPPGDYSPAPLLWGCPRKSRRNCTSTSAQPPNSNSGALSPAHRKTSPSPAHPPSSIFNGAPSPLCSTNAPLPISR